MAPKQPIMHLLISTILCINYINAQKTVEESSTGALLTFPDTMDGPLYGKEWDVAPAQFGYQKYGGTLKGWLVLPMNETYHKECPKCQHGVHANVTDMCTDEGPEPLESNGDVKNPYIHYVRDWYIEEDDTKDYILVIDRLDCYFVNKIEHAQRMGASGVIMCDWRYHGNLFTMWMPQDWTDEIDIPSVLLSNEHCQTLMEHIGVKNWDPNYESVQYPIPEAMNWTLATIEWGLPHPDDVVEYELWTSSNDYLGSQFKHNFNTTAIELDLANDTQFTPHMYILDGSHWRCDEVDSNGTHTLPCKRQCTNSGRYCAVDPEYDLSIGLDGMDVIQENLRNLCVWKYDKQSGARWGRDDVLWWDYAVLWDENCGVYSNSSKNFHANCSFAQMDRLRPDGSLSAYVKLCIANSGGYGYTDGRNSILQAEMKFKYNQSIYAVPLVRVNEFLIHGKIDCDPPVTVATCEVLAAICAGFVNGTAPDVCSITPAPTIVTCTAAQKDCAGVCFGPHHNDSCGQCLTYADPLWNECVGCNGQVGNVTFDCEGKCGGHYKLNVCGYCKDTQVSGWDTFGIDCNGGCDMNLRLDECGQCLDEFKNASIWNNCIDCEGVPHGYKELNPCDFCLDTRRGDWKTYGQDCRGKCAASSSLTYTLDRCDKCLSTDDVKRDICVGCDDVPYSNKTWNPCNKCVDKNDPEFDNIGRDCTGGCPASEDERYYYDECGQCLLPTNPDFSNCCDGDPNKRTNLCGYCILMNQTDFNDYGRDCAGTCNGDKLEDECGQCLHQSNPGWNNCTDCEGTIWGNKKENDCGHCMDPTASDFDTYGKNCDGECMESTETTYGYDRCGQCLATSDESWDTCVGCDNEPNSGKMFNDCGYCIDADADNFDTYGQDCRGECATPSEPYYLNDCGYCMSTLDSDFATKGKNCNDECDESNTYSIDDCGNCKSEDDSTRNICDDASSSSGGGDGSGSSSSSDSGVIYIIIAIAAFVLIIVAFGVIFWQCKRHNEMKKQFADIIQNYQPMEDLASSNTKKTKSKPKGGNYTTSVPGDESD